jgi:haloalkane dehalogenase
MTSPYETDVSSSFPFTLHKAHVLGLEMAYVDTRPDATSGPTVLFIHGNGTSSYLWRNVIPHVSPIMRCVAPDLIGMGESSIAKHLPYRFTDHYTFFSTFINQIIPSGPILLVVHDWGSALGLHWAWQQAELSNAESPSRVLGVALMEFVRPFATWEDLGLPPMLEEAFRAFRTPDVGRKLIIEENRFMQSFFSGSQLRKLSDEEVEHYSNPFTEPSHGEVLYAWVYKIPIEQRPSDVYDISTRSHDWLMSTKTPTLLFWATPGAIITPARAKWYSENLQNATVVDLGQGLHYLQEDHPRAIGTRIASWAESLIAGGAA